MDTTTDLDPNLGPNEWPTANFDDTPSVNEWAVIDDLESRGAFDEWDDHRSDAY